MNTIRTAMLVTDICILLCIVIGFFVLKKSVDIKKNNDTDNNKKAIQCIAISIGAVIALLSMVVLSLGIYAKVK